MKVTLSLLRGICQTPAYVAHERGFFRDQGLDSEIHIEPTAWLVPDQLASGDAHFAVLPWTRVATGPTGAGRMVVCAGSGVEEAALVVRSTLKEDQVRSVVVPREGGMKDLTAMALVESLGWHDVDVMRQPSGDGAIISFFASGADAASMVEPYATLMEELGVGRVIRRTGDIWPGAPGCSLATTAALIDQDPKRVGAAVRAFARAADFVRADPDETARIAHRYIGVAPEYIRAALAANAPDVSAIRNEDAIRGTLALMRKLGYIDREPTGFIDTRFLDALGDAS